MTGVQVLGLMLLAFSPHFILMSLAIRGSIKNEREWKRIVAKHEKTMKEIRERNGTP